LRALKNLENASLTRNQPKISTNFKNTVFWADSMSGNRFQDFSKLTIDSSHRKTHIGYFIKKFIGENGKIPVFL
jgi:hypothetical protein